MNTYNVADVAAATAGTVAVVFGWNRADTEAFAAVAASCGVSTAAATNPLGMMVAVDRHRIRLRLEPRPP